VWCNKVQCCIVQCGAASSVVQCINLYSASRSAHQLEALPVRVTQRELVVLRKRKEALGSKGNKEEHVKTVRSVVK